MATNRSFGLDVGIYGPEVTTDSVLSLARLADDLDFASVWVADHVALPVSYKSMHPYSGRAFPTDVAVPLFEPIAAIGVLVGATKRVKIGTAVLVMPYRQPVLLSRMLITLDNFSAGRIMLGAGSGWLAEEFELLGADFAKRGRATDEQLEIFKALCAGGTVGYQGQVYKFDPIYSVPGSVQRPHPPILIGGITDVALRRTARLGDGWLSTAIDPGTLKERLATLKRLCDERGRKFESLTLMHKVFINIGEPQKNKFGSRQPGTGTKQQIIDDLKGCFDLGYQQVIFRSRAGGIDETRRQIERFANEIVPRV